MESNYAFNNVALITVTYNSAAMAVNFAKTAILFRHVWIADNQSSDNTPAKFLECVPHLNLLALPSNLGFGAANNIGFAASRESCSRVLIMNPDCSIDQASVRLLVSALDEHKNAAVVSPVVFPDKGGEPNLKLRDYSEGFRASEVRALSYSVQLPEIIHEACLDGACLLVESSRFEQIGAFDENLFMYSEEDDISMRLALFGFSKITVRDAIAKHIGGASSAYSTLVEIRKKYHQRWSSYYVISKYEGRPQSKWSCIKTLSGSPIALVFYSLCLNKKYLIKWLGWTLASIDSLLSSKIFRRI